MTTYEKVQTFIPFSKLIHFLNQKRATENNHAEIVKLLLNQPRINLHLLDKFQRDCLSIALKNKNDIITKLLEQKRDEQLNLNEATSNEFVCLGERLESSSLKASFNENNLNEKQNMKSLNDFYKKKSFAKTLTSKSTSTFKNFSSETLISNTVPPSSSSSSSSSARLINSNNESKKVPIKNWKLILDEEDSSSSSNEFLDFNDDKEEAAGCLSEDEMKSSNKKKRLSMSPLNKIEDTLYWLKKNHQSKKSSDDDYLEKKEFSLTG